MKKLPAAEVRRRTPVLIIGGGPVGLATALELSQHGIGCIVVEPRAGHLVVAAARQDDIDADDGTLPPMGDRGHRPAACADTPILV